jgi:hypothetical protein
MIAIDELQALFSKSAYLTPVGGPVESYNLSTPALFLDYLMGTESLVRLTSLTPPCPPFLPTSLSRTSHRTSPSHSLSTKPQHPNPQHPNPVHN